MLDFTNNLKIQIKNNELSLLVKLIKSGKMVKSDTMIISSVSEVLSYWLRE